MSLAGLAKRVAQRLKYCQTRVVFAESCTAGLLAASLARVPGISEYLCGSAVTYRNDTKHRWIGVPRQLLISPGPVSEVVAQRMVQGVLKSTPEADLGAAVTGHLGPAAPPNQDGLVFIAIAHKSAVDHVTEIPVQRLKLQSRTRYARQREAAERVFDRLLVALQHTSNQ